jgi:hypothetical protein
MGKGHPITDDPAAPEITSTQNSAVFEEKPLLSMLVRHEIRNESIPNDGSGRHQYFSDSDAHFEDLDSDDDDAHPELGDSEDEEDVPDMPNEHLSSHQRARREARVEKERNAAMQQEKSDEANRRFDQRCEEREAAIAAARDQRSGEIDEEIKKAKVRKQRRKRSTIVQARKTVKFAMGGCHDGPCDCQLRDEPNTDVCAKQSPPKNDTTVVSRPMEYVPMSDFLCQSSGAKVHPSVACILEGETIQEMLPLVGSHTTWQDVEFEVALDSGCTDNVCHSGDAPGYTILESLGSKCGQGFRVGNGERVPNVGEVHLSLETSGEDAHRLTSTFQVAKVSRPLMSVGRLCDAGMEVRFSKDKASVIAPDGSIACVFERQGSGLYLAKLKLKRPELPFGRQGS